MDIAEDASQPMDCDEEGPGSEKGEKEKSSDGGVGRVIFCQDHDYLHQIQDEICLEGLDGITLQALWLRLGQRPGYSLGLTEEAKLFVWSCVLALQEVGLYQLNEARADLVLHDRQGDCSILLVFCILIELKSCPNNWIGHP